MFNLYTNDLYDALYPTDIHSQKGGHYQRTAILDILLSTNERGNSHYWPCFVEKVINRRPGMGLVKLHRLVPPDKECTGWGGHEEVSGQGMGSQPLRVHVCNDHGILENRVCFVCITPPQDQAGHIST